MLDGNGFKTSTMRLGADVIVFSRARHLGYTFLIGLFYSILTFLNFLFFLLNFSLAPWMLTMKIGKTSYRINHPCVENIHRVIYLE